MNIKHLQEQIKLTWCKETSYDSQNWSSDNSAYGQCSVTACVIQDYLGGDILWCQALEPKNPEPIDHYLNIVDGQIIDLTKVQFSKGTKFTVPVSKKKNHATTRDFILSYPETLNRYKLLKEQLKQRTI